MKEINVTSWEGFEAELRKLKEIHTKTYDRLLFRGQSDASNALSTTLERTAGGRYYMSDCLIIRIKSEVESFTGVNWKAPKYQAADKFAAEYDAMSLRMTGGKLPAYSYMVYLRHHGFPSPLLDWTLSPYVAAYFAFRRKTSERSAIFVLSEWPKGMKARSNTRPSIYSFGSPSRGHKRHFNQQSRYTVCVGHDTARGWAYVSHESLFSDQPHDAATEQDMLYKIVIPSSVRVSVLKKLTEYNLNAFSLFGSEESLMETLTFREFGIGQVTPIRIGGSDS